MAEAVDGRQKLILALQWTVSLPPIIWVSIALGACGQLMLKGAAKNLPPFSQLGVGGLLTKMSTTPLMLAAFASFFVSAVLWVLAIRRANLSVAYPATALSYVIIFLGSNLLFQEVITWRHWAGAGLILCGIMLIAAQR